MVGYVNGDYVVNGVLQLFIVFCNGNGGFGVGGLFRNMLLNSFVLIEYSVKLIFFVEDKKDEVKKVVLDEYLLLNGNLDVSYFEFIFSF